MRQSYVRVHTDPPAGFHMGFPSGVVVSVIDSGKGDDTVEATLLDLYGSVHGGQCWTPLTGYDLLHLFGTVNCASDLRDAAKRLFSNQHLKQFQHDWGG